MKLLINNVFKAMVGLDFDRTGEHDVTNVVLRILKPKESKKELWQQLESLKLDIVSASEKRKCPIEVFPISHDEIFARIDFHSLKSFGELIELLKSEKIEVEILQH